jgi:hypothetical protein
MASSANLQNLEMFLVAVFSECLGDNAYRQARHFKKLISLWAARMSFATSLRSIDSLLSAVRAQEWILVSRLYR